MSEKTRDVIVGAGLVPLVAGILFLTTTATNGGILDATWTAPTVNTDGSPLTDLAFYRLYYGTSGSPCPGGTSIQIAAPSARPSSGQTMSFRLTGLASGTLYTAAVTAVDTSGAQSACSNIASAVARADFALSPTGTVSFGTVSLGASADRTFTLTNIGGGTLSGAVSVAAPFSVVSGSPFTLGGTGATQTVTVRFSPTATTTSSTSVTFTAGGGSLSAVVTGSGTGSAPSSSPPPSTTLTVGSRVRVVQTINVRATAGGTLLGTQPTGALGRIVAGPQLAAISGSGSTTRFTYWQIDYDSGVDGWSGQDNLVLDPPVAQPPASQPPTGQIGIGSRVQVVQPINVRATAGGTLLGTQPAGVFGKIVGGPQQATISGTGILTQFTFWQIDYDTGVDGWSGQDNLVLAPPVTQPPAGQIGIGGRVQVVQPINVRATAGGTLLGTQPAGAFGKVIGGPQQATISGTGIVTQFTFWQIDYDSGVDGWSGQDNLSLAP